MYVVKGYCASFRLFEEEVEEGELKQFFDKKHAQLKALELKIIFGVGEVQPASELCCDVYDKATGKWRNDLSQAFKIDAERVYEWLARRHQTARG